MDGPRLDAGEHELVPRRANEEVLVRPLTDRTMSDGNCLGPIGENNEQGTRRRGHASISH